RHAGRGARERGDRGAPSRPARGQTLALRRGRASGRRACPFEAAASGAGGAEAGAEGLAGAAPLAARAGADERSRVADRVRFPFGATGSGARATTRSPAPRGAPLASATERRARTDPTRSLAAGLIATAQPRSRARSS